MGDLPTASTSTASTSSASTSQINPYMFRLANRDLDCTSSDESEISDRESNKDVDDESTNSNEVESCMSFEESEKDLDEVSNKDMDENDRDTSETSIEIEDNDNAYWSSASSSTVSCLERSENSETEKLSELLLTEAEAEAKEEMPDDTTPILILVQVLLKTNKYNYIENR